MKVTGIFMSTNTIIGNLSFLNELLNYQHCTRLMNVILDDR